MRKQAALPCGERTFQAESIAQAKAPHRSAVQVCPRNKETSAAGALVSMGDIRCELGTEESQRKIWKDEDLERDTGFYSKYEEKQQGILCRAVTGMVQLIFLERLSVPLLENFLIFFWAIV